jgi:hypothetical protein
MLAAEFGTGQVLWSMVWFTLFFVWVWLLVTVFADIFRSDDLSGWGKALWSIFVIFMPYLGVFVYLIARGAKMHEHAVQTSQAVDDAQRQYIRETVGAGNGASTASEIARLADLRDKGVIDEAEFQQAKAKALGTAVTTS